LQRVSPRTSKISPIVALLQLLLRRRAAEIETTALRSLNSKGPHEQAVTKRNWNRAL
jgi:hypothetical protein